MNYEEAAAYIEDIPKFTVKHPVGHTGKLLECLGNPSLDRKIIHVAGTNGKGSVCSYLESMLRLGGKRVGMFTSPHLIRINERFVVDGQAVSDETFLAAFEKVMETVGRVASENREHPSYFEFLFLMGMVIFEDADVEYIILETGLGGRLDATNVTPRPLACTITSISRDHTEYLGETIPEIAAEKAGIIKPGVPVIYDGQNGEAAEVIRRRAEELGSPYFELRPSMYRRETVSREGISFVFEPDKGVPVRLKIPYIADYQMMNASLAYFTMECLKDVHGIPEEILVRGIEEAHWPCRMETVLPGVIIDGAHNEDGIAQFIRTAAHFAEEQEITILFSTVRDKKYEEMIHEICEGIRPARVVATQIGGSREVPAQVLAEDFRKAGCREVYAQADVAGAFEQAYEMKGDGMLFCVGSLYLAGELKDYIGRRQRGPGASGRAKEEKHAQLRGRTEEI